MYMSTRLYAAEHVYGGASRETTDCAPPELTTLCVVGGGWGSSSTSSVYLDTVEHVFSDDHLEHVANGREKIGSVVNMTGVQCGRAMSLECLRQIENELAHARSELADRDFPLRNEMNCKLVRV